MGNELLFCFLRVTVRLVDAALIDSPVSLT